MAPIILIHGFLGYRRFLLWELFSGVVEALKEKGITAFRPLVHPTASIEERAKQLLDFIVQEIGAAEPIHIVAHSLGGLDARYLISPKGLDQGGRVISLTTLSTPHHGSCLAEIIPESLRSVMAKGADIGRHLILSEEDKSFLTAIAENRWDSLVQLTPAYVREVFNPKVIDAPPVRYFSYAGSIDPSRITLNTLIRKAAWQYIHDCEVENDGMVSVQSAQWGEFRGVLPADHSEVIGLMVNPWGKNTFDHVAFFLALAEYLETLENQ